MKVFVCIGSSCHLKGSYEIIKKMQSLIDENNIADKVQLNASFCLGNCTNGVSVKIDEDDVIGFSPETTEELFNKHILSRV